MTRAERLLKPVGLSRLARSRAYRALRDPAWTLLPRARASRQALHALKNSQAGLHGHIIGTGPSLRQVDFSKLHGKPSIALNRFYLGFEEFGFVPDFLVCVNLLMLEQSGRDLGRLPCTVLASWAAREHIPQDEDVVYFRTLAGVGFSRDLCEKVYTGGTVTHVALQLAHWLGWSTVTLIGIDHHYDLQPDEVEAGPHQVVERSIDDLNHFVPSYFASGSNWQVPDLEQSETAYALARREFERDNREVLYGTVGGRLEVFEHAGIDYSKK